MSRILKIDELVGNEIEANISVEPKKAIVISSPEIGWPMPGMTVDSDNFSHSALIQVGDLKSDISKFKDEGWTADFFMSVDKPIPSTQITFGGQYGAFPWISFNFTQLPTPMPAIPVGMEFPLVQMMTMALPPYQDAGETTYEDIINMQEFKCGIHVTNIGVLNNPTVSITLRAKNGDGTKEKILCTFGVRIPTVNNTFVHDEI